MKPHNPDLVIGDDGLARPIWAVNDPQLRNYYDTEWGLPVCDEQGVFERLCLEGFQAGLSWRLILQKRDNFRAAYYNFDPDLVAQMEGIEHLLNDERLIRNRLKLQAVLKNAQATIAMREHGGLAEFIWSFQPDETPLPEVMADVPTSSPESIAMAKELKKRGFSFVGSTICFALMEAIGIVDTHLVGSWRRGSSGVWPC
ncbi:DNA-3-methyladenine glycosylase I [Corynebacterium breve]|uniref:DNA-3-methyladenine glycosylase I n=1 Tax=Corynebacterium breve TaxID=3049799 RepID=A0ABY8VG16_9CORY|nr:DNA-3-methyladenine glycosylase I [Corynebacterium breve]WIM68429.1 DNA-3-methyladenine glycosylase I [Corynebacterium breve]